MGYIRAEDILPPDVLALVQRYVDGRMLCIPKKRTDRSEWGSASGSKTYYAKRNAAICAEHRSGAGLCELEAKYCLSQKSIQRILRGEKRLGCKRARGEEEVL